MSSPSILWLTDDTCLDVCVAGGKGAGLGAMTAAGPPGPAGLVVPPHLLGPSVEGAPTAAYERLGGAVAVRSSACAEDSQAASYAGQHETFLGVRGVDAVCARVVDCWASFFSERALFYRERKGSLADLRMAVVVQQMLDPVKSGVLFTVDPVHRRRDRMVVEAVFGLGEQVVSGAVTPDHYVIDRAGNIKREHIVDKRVLEPEEIRQIVELGRKLEEHFGKPQDIEWGIENGNVYLLQSRPVTTL